MLNIAILASGNGTNAAAVINKINEGILTARVSIIICNRPGAGVIARARDYGVSCETLDHKEYPDRESYDLALLDALERAGCELVVLAGYMRLLTRRFLETRQGTVMNIHPSLLPSFPGIHGIRDAFGYGVKLTGPSVHFVGEETDRGPLIIQAAVPCDPGEGLDALESKIHAAEHRIYPQAIQWFAEGRLKLDGRVVRLEDAGKRKIPNSGDMFVYPPLEEGF
ncbi:MAG: phosphoribosylglycinamide formyltransferase [Desulfovibrio sp.]|nr:phosphoribosylglycinamide formyltransferase [Desulfovibrio sp.]